MCMRKIIETFGAHVIISVRRRLSVSLFAFRALCLCDPHPLETTYMYRIAYFL